MNNKNISQMPGGRSASIIFTTYDQRFVIKTIESCERKILIRLLPRYSNRITCNPESKLVRILGLYQILPERQDFVIMENIIPDKSCSVIFDLKGSTIDRLVPRVNYDNLPLGKTMKDENFRKSNLKIKLDEPLIKFMINTLKNDFEILKNENIMDYSILLAFYKKPLLEKNRYQIDYLGEKYAIGIIDILQDYNLAKITEEKWKSLYKKNRSMLSVAEPDFYFQRITSFLQYLFESSNKPV